MTKPLIYLLIIPISAAVAAFAGPYISELLMLSSRSEMITVSMMVFFFTAVCLRLGLFLFG